MGKHPLLSGDLELNNNRQTWRMWMRWAVLRTFDLVASLLMSFVLLWSGTLTVTETLACLAVIILAGSLWRIHRARLRSRNTRFAGLPSTCGAIAVDDRELVIVATVHISPRATEDVEAVLCKFGPFDVVMIELDEERLGQVRFAKPQTKDLQPITITMDDGKDTLEFFAQRATWNNQWKDRTISGPIIFNADDPHGVSQGVCNRALAPSEIGNSNSSHLALVFADGPEDEQVPATRKVYNAWCAGAQALIVISSSESLPSRPIGELDMWQDLKVAFRTGNFGYPQIPVLVLPHTDGTKLQQLCQAGELGAHGKFEVLEHNHPCRTLSCRVGLECAFALSGVSILHSVADYLDVEPGTEFTTAEAIATETKVACECIDVSIDNLCGCLKNALVPTPCNVGAAILSWLAVPRAMWRSLFPAQPTLAHQGSDTDCLGVDIIGTMVLHALSFRCRTWCALATTVVLSGLLLAGILHLIGSVAESAAEEAAGEKVSQSDRWLFTAWIMIGIELFAIARVYQTVASSRDDAMYKRIVSVVRRRPEAKRFFAVVGAAHVNGILSRLKRYGF